MDKKDLPSQEKCQGGKYVQSAGLCKSTPLNVEAVVSNHSNHWDVLRSQDLPEVVNDTGPGDSVAVQVMMKMAEPIKHACVERLAFYLWQRHLLNQKELEHCLSPQMRVGVKLADGSVPMYLKLSLTLQDCAKQPATAKTFLRTLYLSLRDSYEEGCNTKTDNHFHLANTLIEEVRNCLMTDSDSKPAIPAADLRTAIERIVESGFDPEIAIKLMQSLGVQNLSPTSYKQICLHWLDMNVEKCTMGQLVSALLASGLGKLSSGLLPICQSNPPLFQNFVFRLPNPETAWKSLALFLGYKPTDDEVCFVDRCPIAACKPNVFLRVFNIPDCQQEMESVISIIHRGMNLQVGVSVQGAESSILPKTQSKENVPASGHKLPANAKPSDLTGFSPQWQSEAKKASYHYRPIGQDHKHHPKQNQQPAPSVEDKGVTSKGSSKHRRTDKSARISPEERRSAESKRISKAVSQKPVNPEVPSHGQSQQKSKTGHEIVPKSVPKPTTNPTQQKKPEAYRQPPQQAQHASLSQQGTSPARPKIRYDPVEFLDMCYLGNDWPRVDRILSTIASLGEERESEEGKTAFHYLCMDGTDINRIKSMIAKGAQVTHVDKCGCCVLHYHAVLRNEQLLRLLLTEYDEKQISVDVPTMENFLTPLMTVCTIGDAVYSSAKLLLDHGASPNGNPKAHSTPLIVACEGSRNLSQLVELLVQYGADYNLKDKEGYTLLLKACISRNWNVARFLLGLAHLNTINTSDKSGTTPLFAAVSENCYEMVELLLEKGAGTQQIRIRQKSEVSGCVEETPLAHACGRGFLNIVQLLLKNGADINFKCSNSVAAIGFAIINRQNYLVEYLLNECPQLDKSLFGLRGPIIISIKVENHECTRLMLDKLGGPEQAAQQAERNGLQDLLQHIQTYMLTAGVTQGFVKNRHLPLELQQQHSQVMPPTHRQPPRTYQPHFDKDNRDHIEEVLLDFCKICMKVLESKLNISKLAEVARASNPEVPEIANFFQRCATNNQREDRLKIDFLGPNKEVSPLSYVISQGAILREEFMVHATVFCKGQEREFVDQLLHTFHTISNDPSLSWNGDVVLDQLFSGQFSLNSSQYPVEYPGSDHRERLSSPPPLRSSSWGGSDLTSHANYGPVDPVDLGAPRPYAKSAGSEPRPEFSWPNKLSKENVAKSFKPPDCIIDAKQPQLAVLPLSTKNVLTNKPLDVPASFQRASPRPSAVQPDISMTSTTQTETHMTSSTPVQGAAPAAQSEMPTHTETPSQLGESQSTSSSVSEYSINSSLLSYPSHVQFDPPATNASTPASDVSDLPVPPNLWKESSVSTEQSTDMESADGVRRTESIISEGSVIVTAGDSESDHHVRSTDTESEVEHPGPSLPETSSETGKAERHSSTRDWAVLKPYKRHVQYTGKSLGYGAFGSVEIVTMKGKEYAAKMFRDDHSSAQKHEIAKRYHTELEILSCLEHFNIVQYIGVAFKKGHERPLLLMEKLDTDLHQYLTNTPNISMYWKLSILHDTASGLKFLHTRTPVVIHRDLTAKNVLLDSKLRAKITDFGNARIMEIDVTETVSMTAQPGTLAYTAPEAQQEGEYGWEIDIFSFGHLSLFTITQVFTGPKDLLPTKFKRKGERRLSARSEVERRVKAFKKLYNFLDREHEVTHLITICLDDDPSQRPTTTQILEVLRKHKAELRAEH